MPWLCSTNSDNVIKMKEKDREEGSIQVQVFHMHAMHESDKGGGQKLTIKTQLKELVAEINPGLS